MAEKKNVFEVLNAINVNEHTESKNGLTYLSWSWAWSEVKKKYPDATYEIVKFDGIPYAYDPLTGFMVYTRVTIEGITHEMWLPVMDSQNRAMKAEPYQVKTKYKTFDVEPATMFDVNKTIMRCLVKNLAMFGLGLYIYAGEDLPETEDAEEAPAPKAKKTAPKKVAEPKAETPAPVTQTAPTKPSYPNRNKFLKFCQDNELNTASLCNELSLTKESRDEDFIPALSRAIKEVAKKKSEKQTGADKG